MPVIGFWLVNISRSWLFCLSLREDRGSSALGMLLLMALPKVTTGKLSGRFNLR